MITLTPREQQILSLIARGYLNKQIAAELGISEDTVKAHNWTMFQKLGAINRANAVARYILRFLDPDAL